MRWSLLGLLLVLAAVVTSCEATPASEEASPPPAGRTSSSSWSTTSGGRISAATVAPSTRRPTSTRSRRRGCGSPTRRVPHRGEVRALRPGGGSRRAERPGGLRAGEARAAPGSARGVEEVGERSLPARAQAPARAGEEGRVVDRLAGRGRAGLRGVGPTAMFDSWPRSCDSFLSCWSWRSSSRPSAFTTIPPDRPMITIGISRSSAPRSTHLPAITITTRLARRAAARRIARMAAPVITSSTRPLLVSSPVPTC